MVFIFSFGRIYIVFISFHINFYLNSSGEGGGGSGLMFLLLSFLLLVKNGRVGGTTWRLLEKLNNLKGIKKGPDYTQTTVC